MRLKQIHWEGTQSSKAMNLFKMNMWSADASVHQRPNIDVLGNSVIKLVSVIVMSKHYGTRRWLVKMNRVLSGRQMIASVRERVWCQEV